MTVNHYIKSLKAAVSGIAHVWKEEKSFRLEVFIGSIVFLLAVFLELERIDFIIIIFVIGIVLILELINTLVERMVDLFKPRIHDYARIIKNIMASIVLISAIIAIIIGCMVFFPYLTPFLLS